MKTARLTEQIFQIDFDRALSAQFAPRAKRHGLHLLVLFDHELAKISRQTTDPILRLIRTQFWREALADKKGNGVKLAQQLVDCFSASTKMCVMLDELIETHEKYFEESHIIKQVWTQYNDRQAQLFKLAVGFLDPENMVLDGVFYEHCGVAYGGVQQLCAGFGVGPDSSLELHHYIDQIQSSLEGLDRDLKALPAPIRAAVLPMALVPPYLHLFQSSDTELSKPVDLHPFKKLFVLWRVARNGF